MTRIDLVAVQQRLAQQQPKPVPAEPPSWSTRPATASPLRTTPAPKARSAAALAAAPAGTLRATTTMRAALPLKVPNARAERARANALRAQIDELKGQMAVASAEADRALEEERKRADRLSEWVEALSAEVVRAEKQAEAAVGRAERAEAGWDAERARAEALRTSIDELKAGQALMVDIHARELAVTRQDALAIQEWAAELRRAGDRAERRGGLWRGSGAPGGGSETGARRGQAGGRATGRAARLGGKSPGRVPPLFNPAEKKRIPAEKKRIPAEKKRIPRP